MSPLCSLQSRVVYENSSPFLLFFYLFARFLFDCNLDLVVFNGLRLAFLSDRIAIIVDVIEVAEVYDVSLLVFPFEELEI